METKQKKIHMMFGNDDATLTPPPPITCEFCKKQLYSQPIYHPYNRTKVLHYKSHDRCTCDQAYAYWVVSDIEEAEKKKAQAQSERMAKRMAWVARLIDDSCLKKRFLTRTFLHFEKDLQAEAYEIAYDYANNFQRYKERGAGIYLQGPCGTGKTHLAAAIALHLLNEGVPVVFKTMMDLLQDIKNTYAKKDATEKLVDVYRSVDLLIIDDMGKEPPTEWAVATLYSIINDRYERCLPTIFTSNYNNETLVMRLSKNGDSTTAISIADRIKEIAETVTMVGESYRNR